MRRFPFTAGQVLCLCWVLFSLFLCVVFSCCFLFVFWSFWGVILEPFWEQNRVKIRICDFLIFIDFLLVFILFLRFGGSYFRLMLALFSLHFLHRILVVFWTDLGVILGPFGGHFGGPNRSFWASIFGLFLHVVPRAAKSGPRAPKSGPRAPKRGPRAAQERPRAVQERPRAAQERPRAAQERPRAAKSGPRAAKRAKSSKK